MYLEYPSSLDSRLRLFADFHVPPEPRRLRLHMHGWHGHVKKEHENNVPPGPEADWFLIQPEMRGRGDAEGKQDCNGWELQDAVDAIEFARKRFADYIRDPELVALDGGSGGGGNVFAMLGKFPDYFCRAKSECGISDYALWYRNDEQGEFRDELEPWIGATPKENPEAYAARSGLTTVGNLLTPLIIFHGETDVRVPCDHSRRFVAKAKELGVKTQLVYHELPGVGTRDHYGNITPEQREFKAKEGPAFLRREAHTIEIPERGRFVIAGYLKTKRFEIEMGDVGHIGMVDYDLEWERFEVAAPTSGMATVRIARNQGHWDSQVVVPRRCSWTDIPGVA